MAYIFCEGIEEKQILLQTKKFKVVLDIDPIQSGHLLIISKKHFMDVRELTDSALMELLELQSLIKSIPAARKLEINSNFRQPFLL